MIIVSVHVRFFSFVSFVSLCQFMLVYVSQVTSGYIRLHQVDSVYVGGTGRGARQHFIQIIGTAMGAIPAVRYAKN